MNKKKVDFDSYTEDYNRLLKEGTGFFSESEAYFAKYKVDVLRGLAPTGVRRILEYGCGIGRNIPYLCAAFPDAKIFGSDISSVSLEVARNTNHGVEFFVESADVIVDEPYEVIFVAGVFHHIPINQRPIVMQTLRKRLSHGGVLVIFEHNPYNPVTRKIVNDCPYDRDAILLKPSELKRLLERAGLAVQRSAYCLFVPPSLPSLFPIESKLGWLPLGGQYWVEAKRSE